MDDIAINGASASDVFHVTCRRILQDARVRYNPALSHKSTLLDAKCDIAEVFINRDETSFVNFAKRKSGNYVFKRGFFNFA